VDSFNYTEHKLPDSCGYNKIFKHQWKIGTYGLSMVTINEIQNLIKGKWGWHFIPHKDMDYRADNWYESQECILSFENKWDLILSKLFITIHK